MTQDAESDRPVDLAEKLVKALIERIDVDQARTFDIEIPLFIYDHVRAIVRVSVEA